MRFHLSLTIIFILLGGLPAVFMAGFACRNDTVGPPTTNIALTAEDVAVTEVWLRVQIAQWAQHDSIRLARNDTTILALAYKGYDTLLLDDGLLSKQTYTYKLHTFSKNMPSYSSDALTITTMDTTSHTFMWEIDTLGDGASSVLNDVAVINDTCVWAVGEIFIRDSSGNFINPPFNIARWNGKRWTLERSFEQGYLYGALYAIFPFGPDNIWVGSTIPEHWDGTKWTFYGTARGFPTSFYIRKIWGTSTNNLYWCGVNGAIAHYDGRTWEKIESGTNVNLTDIWGTPDGKKIWTCGWNDSDGRSILLALEQGNWQALWRSEVLTPPYIYRSFLSSLWSSSSGEFILTGGEVYRHSLLDLNIVRHEYVKTENGTRLLDLGNFSYRIRGNARNDVLLAGDDAMIWHWNGITWHRYDELLNQNDVLYSVAVSDKEIIAVGTRYGDGPFRYGLIILGRR